MSSIIHPQEVAITLITYYPKWYRSKLKSIKHTDKVRGDLALEFIAKSLKLNYQIVVVDGKSSGSFRKILSQTNGLIIKHRRLSKRSPAKRQAFKIASRLDSVKAIISTEPEKVSLVTDCLPQIVEPLLKNQADIVIPNRKPQLFKETYPQYQYDSETEGNQLYNEYLRQNGLLPKESPDLDMFFGPRAFANKPQILALFMRRFKLKTSNISIPQEYFDAEEYSNTLLFPIVLALKKRLKIKSIEVPFKYPAIQKENEEIGAKELFLEKRRTQRLSILLELTHFVSYLEKNQQSKIKVQS